MLGGARRYLPARRGKTRRALGRVRRWEQSRELQLAFAFRSRLGCAAELSRKSCAIACPVNPRGTAYQHPTYEHDALVNLLGQLSLTRLAEDTLACCMTPPNLPPSGTISSSSSWHRSNTAGLAESQGIPQVWWCSKHQSCR